MLRPGNELEVLEETIDETPYLKDYGKGTLREK